MRNPFRHNRREEGAARAVAPERRGYEGEGQGQGYEGGGAPARREPVAAGPGETRPAEEPRRGAEEPRRGAEEPQRRSWRRRSVGAGSATVGAVGGGVLMLARLVMTVAALIALLIAISIVLFDVGATPTNAIVEGIREGANFFAGAFTGMITFARKPKLELTVNWGIALVVYLIVGAVIASLIRSIGSAGVRFDERHRPAAL